MSIHCVLPSGNFICSPGMGEVQTGREPWSSVLSKLCFTSDSCGGNFENHIDAWPLEEFWKIPDNTNGPQIYVQLNFILFFISQDLPIHRGKPMGCKFNPSQW